MTAQNVVFLFVLVLGAGFFALNVQRLVSYLRLGYAENRTDHPLARFKNVLVIGIAQKKIFRDPVAGPMHALIFWGFMVLTAGTVEILLAGGFSSFFFALFFPPAIYPPYSASPGVFAPLLIAGVFPSFSYALFLPRSIYAAYSASQDVFALLVIAAVGFALYRRLVLHPKRLEGDNLEHTDALIILSMIMGLMVTLLLFTAF